MPSYENDVRRQLLDHGCSLVRQGKGDHEIWQSPMSNRRFVVDAKIKSRHTANGVMKQAGIDHKF